MSQTRAEHRLIEAGLRFAMAEAAGHRPDPGALVKAARELLYVVAEVEAEEISVLRADDPTIPDYAPARVA